MRSSEILDTSGFQENVDRDPRQYDDFPNQNIAFQLREFFGEFLVGIAIESIRKVPKYLPDRKDSKRFLRQK